MPGARSRSLLPLRSRGHKNEPLGVVFVNGGYRGGPINIGILKIPSLFPRAHVQSYTELRSNGVYARRVNPPLPPVPLALRLRNRIREYKGGVREGGQDLLTWSAAGVLVGG